MITFPVMSRELRVTARHKRTFYLRMAFGGLLSLGVLTFLLTQMLSRNRSFVGLNLQQTLCWEIVMAILMIAPALTCGVVSDEKRDGTLGLLFLTDLRPTEIILGKLFSRGFDLLWLLLSAVPFLFVPIMMGGVQWDQTLGSFVNMLALLVLTLAVGVWSSTLARTTSQALLVAYGTLALYNLAFPLAGQLLIAGGTLAPPGTGTVSRHWLELASPLGGLMSFGGVTAQFNDSLVTLLCCMVVFLALVVHSITMLPRVIDHDRYRAPWKRWIGQNVFPTLRRLLSKLRRRLLDQRPVRWLYVSRQHSWGLQLLLVAGVAIGWFVILPEQIAVMGGMLQSIYLLRWIAGFLIKILIVVTVTRAFASEKEDGSLELLLTTPVSERDIVRAKVYTALAQYGLLFLVLQVLPYQRGWMMGWFNLAGLGGAVGNLLFVITLSLLVAAWSRNTTQALLLAVVGVLAMGWVVSLMMSLLLGVIGFGRMIGTTPFRSIISLFGWQFPSFLVNMVVAFLAYRILVRNLRAFAAR